MVRLDPGLAFGTGSHPTTWQCLRWLEGNLHGGESVLDYGCGSGILAIAAKRLKAGQVVGVDIDIGALESSRANASTNGVEIHVARPDRVPPGPYDVVVANILSNPLRILAPLLAGLTRSGGRIALAGILTQQAESVGEAYSPWFEIVRSPKRTAGRVWPSAKTLVKKPTRPVLRLCQRRVTMTGDRSDSLSMYTRCPHCETVFRVTTQQLQVSSGRCVAALHERIRCFHNAELSAVGAYRDYVHAAEARSHPDCRARALVQSKLKPAAELELLTLPDELFGSGAPSVGQRWPWTAGTLLLLVALAGQAAWFFPTDIATRVPELRPLLVQFCAWSQCNVQLPRLPEQLFIEASDLQVLDPAHPSEVLLTAVIRNRAPTSQDFPMLELTLTDASNQTAARKVFSAADYLDTGADVRRGIAANQEISIRVYLDTGSLKATGYRLYLFFV